jgi:acetyl-CoA carboxylase biotin carboxyl carrier protein
MAKKRILAEVAGKVLRVEAPVGTKVAEGDAILLIECMKMEIPVVADEAGSIVEIHVGEGDSIAEGQAVATLES